MKAFKKIIIFDFDDTLFETGKFKKEILKNFEKLGVLRDLFKETYDATKVAKGYWDPVFQLDILKKKLPNLNKRKIIFGLNLIFKKAKDFLFSDTLEFLKKLKKKGGMELILLSFGKRQIQAKKIKNSRIGRFFGKIKITGDSVKKKELLAILKTIKKGQRVYFIDNRAANIDFAKKVNPGIVAIKMKRASGRYAKEDCFSANFAVKNLQELEKIIET